ncbi:MAG: catalase family protein [Candidatus Xenobia bacterium]
MEPIRFASLAACPFAATFAATDKPVAEPMDGVGSSVPPAPPGPPPAAAPLPAVNTTAPSWPAPGAVATALQHASTVSTPQNPLGDILDDSLTGMEAQKFDAQTVREIREYQEREAKAEGANHLSRLIHRAQLFGGQAQVHWNPEINQKLKLFDMDSQQALLRISDASSKPDPDGPTMYGFALEVTGQDGKPTDILLTGGTPVTEHSQAHTPQAQLDLFNMLNAPSKLKGLGRIVKDEGLRGGVRMLLDVKHMETSLDSVANLTAYSRAPFSVQGRDGQTYLVKMRVVPEKITPGLAVVGNTTSERLQNDMHYRTERGETRWDLDFQFAQAGDDVHDPRENWHGPWVPAGEVVVPQTTDKAVARRASDRADATHFNVWKNKEDASPARDRDVLHPFGEINRARLAAYAASGGNRGCPFLASLETH